MLWYSRWKNFLSYLISNQCWSLANQNKSFLSLQTSRVTFSVKHFTLLLNQIFFFIRGGVFLWAYLFKRASDWIQVVRGYWKAISYHLIARIIHSQVIKNLLNGGELYEIYFLGIWKKYLGLVSFWEPLKTCFLLMNIPETRSSFLWIIAFFSIYHFSSLETECTEAAVCCCFSKLVFLKILQHSQENTSVGVSFQ